MKYLNLATQATKDFDGKKDKSNQKMNFRLSIQQELLSVYSWQWGCGAALKFFGFAKTA
jgi:hypothetical protein